MKTKNLEWSDVQKAVGPDNATEFVRRVKRNKRLGIVWEVIAAMLFALFLALALAVFGCATRTTYSSIAATHQATKLAYDGYVDSVIRGQTKTNDLPAVSQAYNLFLVSERVAIDAAQGNPSAPAPADLNTKSTTVINLTKIKP